MSGCKLYAAPRCPFSRKVCIAAYELATEPYMTVEWVSSTPLRPAPELHGLNPLGMIPTMVVGERVIYDSLTIIEFLDTATDGRLVPREGHKRIEALTRHAIANGMLEKSVRMLDEEFRKPNSDTQAHLSAYGRAIAAANRWMEVRLDPERFDIGDIAYFTALSYLDLRFPFLFWREHSASADAWYDSQRHRPSALVTEYKADASLH